jgi:hypothetical protein
LAGASLGIADASVQKDGPQELRATEPVRVQTEGRLLSPSEVSALRQFFELLDEWDQEAKGAN